tara:strand:+ start:2165 stop:2302 length:138 start_codon:yes stop_codon:yes gene_type:complete
MKPFINLIQFTQSIEIKEILLIYHQNGERTEYCKGTEQIGIFLKE